MNLSEILAASVPICIAIYVVYAWLTYKDK